MRVVIAAAGTGGHINPGIAIANKIKSKEKSSEIIFIGTPRGLENDLVPRAGYELKTVDSYGISRSLSPKNIVRLYKTFKSIGTAKKILKEFNPDIVIGTGGYICMSVCKAAQKLKIPYILHESNVLPGISVRLLGKKAKGIFVGFNETKDRLNDEPNVTITGTPCKINKINYTKKQLEEKRKENGLKASLPVVAVFGGSQGAQSINNAVKELISLKLNKNYSIIWATGKDNFDATTKYLKENDVDINKITNAKVVPYIYNMEEIMNMSDLIVCRAGAITTTEIEKCGKAAIFIPFPFAAENHQEYNARALEKAGAAKVILDKNLKASNLHDTIEGIIKDKSVLEDMKTNSQKLSIDDVDDKIYNEIKMLV